MLSRTITTISFVVSIWASTALAQDTIRWETDLAAGQRLAAQTNRLVLVHFWGTWCPPCMEMEKSVFNKPGLGTAVHPYYVPVKIQVEDGMNQDLVKQFQVDGFPCDIVMTAQGQIVSRSKGFKPAGEYVAMLNQAAQQALAAARPIAANGAASNGGSPGASAAPASPYAVPATAPASPYAMQQPSTPAAAVPVASTVGSRYSTTYTPPPAALPQTPIAGAATTSATAPTNANATTTRTDDRYASYFASRGPTPTTLPAATPSTTAMPVAPSQPASSGPSLAAAPIAAAPAIATPTAASPVPGLSASAAGSRYPASTTGDRYATSSVGDRYAASPQLPAATSVAPTTQFSPTAPSTPPAAAPTLPSTVAQPTIAQPTIAQPMMAQPMVAQPAIAQPAIAQPMVAPSAVATTAAVPTTAIPGTFAMSAATPTRTAAATPAAPASTVNTAAVPANSATVAVPTAAPNAAAPAAVAAQPAATQPALAQSTPLASAPPKPHPLASNPAPTTTAPAAKSAAQAALLARIPAGSPPLALDGYCPVTVTEKMVWRQGDPQFGAVHKGRTYLFASAAEQQKFLGNPDKFSPIISGNDPVAIVEEGRIVSGNRDFGVFCGGQMVLFSSAENCNKYRTDQKRYDAGLRQAMQSGAALRR